MRRALLQLTWIVALGGAGLFAVMIAAAWFVGAMAGATEVDDATEALQQRELASRSVVYDRDGNVLAVLHAEENRSPVSLDAVPDHVVDAILAVEDEAFYEHEGVNLRAIARAAVVNAESGTVRQGGSTITQQVVKNSLLSPERDLDRKLKEAVLALRLEQQLSKDRILEQYLNTVYFGNGAYGVQAAAETYWGVDVGQLDLGQAALLAGLIRNPIGYDPVANPEVALHRRRVALELMVEQDLLTLDEVEVWQAIPLPVARHNPLPTRDDYFVEEVKQRLLDDPRLGETPQDRYNAVFRGGLRIESTFDSRLQDLAEKAVNRHLPDTNGQFTAALVSVEPISGAVRAMVAGEGFEKARYNLATGRGGSGRQPGSSFKPFVLLAAYENGFGPRDSINGTEPCPVRLKGWTKSYTPGNYEGSRGSYGPLTSATARSLNCAFVRLALSLDPEPYTSLDKVVDVAKRMGLKGDIESLPAMALGSEEVTPLEMASAYGVLANDGVRHEPYFVQRVLRRDGEVVFDNRRPGEQVIEPNVARAAVYTLENVVRGGTGTRARLPGRDVAGKTGTSQEWRDAWFVGFTPQLSTAVWMGSPVGQVPMKRVAGVGRVTGGSFPAMMWREYMGPALEGEPAIDFREPDLKAFGRAKSVRVPRIVTGGSTRRRASTAPRRRSAPPPPTTAAPDPATDTTAPGPASVTTAPPSPPPPDPPPQEGGGGAAPGPPDGDTAGTDGGGGGPPAPEAEP